jgi:hypothetical protein
MTARNRRPMRAPGSVFPAFGSPGEKWLDDKGRMWVFKGGSSGGYNWERSAKDDDFAKDDSVNVNEAANKARAEARAELAEAEMAALGSAVNHPEHYGNHPSGVECIDIVRHMSFNTGNVFKYLWRAGLKGETPKLQDYKKALWYLKDEILRLEKEEAK